MMIMRVLMVMIGMLNMVVIERLLKVFGLLLMKYCLLLV